MLPTCNLHDIVLVVIDCVACQRKGCSLCHWKGVVRYCPKCREEILSKVKLIRPRL